MQGVALLGPGGSQPQLPIEGLQLSVGLQVHLCEKDDDGDGKPGVLHVDGVIAGWNEKYQCWFATYDWTALKWSPQLEADASLIPFDEWVRRVFAHEVINHDWWWKEDTDWNELPAVISLEYLSRLFEESGHLLRTFSDAQVDQGLWMVLGPVSDHVRALEDLTVQWPIRLRCVRSILILFRMFESRCSHHLAHFDEPGSNPLNSICYMFWDIFQVSGRSKEPVYADLDHALLAVMQEILAQPSNACRESALHGLGHWQAMYPEEVAKIVDSFIADNPKLRPELRLYAERSRAGNVL